MQQLLLIAPRQGAMFSILLMLTVYRSVPNISRGFLLLRGTEYLLFSYLCPIVLRHVATTPVCLSVSNRPFFTHGRYNGIMIIYDMMI